MPLSFTVEVPRRLQLWQSCKYTLFAYNCKVTQEIQLKVKSKSLLENYPPKMYCVCNCSKEK